MPSDPISKVRELVDESSAYVPKWLLKEWEALLSALEHRELESEELKRSLIDYLVESDGEDSIEMLVQGILGIVRAALNPESTKGRPGCDACLGTGFYTGEPCHCRRAALNPDAPQPLLLPQRDLTVEERVALAGYYKKKLNPTDQTPDQ